MYHVKKKNKNFKDALIEKTYEHTLTFTIADIEAHEALLQKAQKEIDAQLMVARAAMQNVETNHPNIKNVTPFEMHAIAVYAENKRIADEAQKKVREITKQMAEYKREKKDIYAALGFDDAQA